MSSDAAGQRSDDRADLPELVRQAQRLAEQTGFALTRAQAGPARPSACLPGVGQFLAMLAAGCTDGVIAELGTGVGVGTAWLASGLPPGGTLITIEVNEDRAALARQLFADDHRVEVITGDALTAVAGRGPFNLIFADYGIRSDEAFDQAISLLRVGGQIVMDDVTPVLALVVASPLQAHHHKRHFFASRRLASTEVVLPDLRSSLLVGTRRC
jgi:predicted O-methyltransferase YrrM